MLDESLTRVSKLFSDAWTDLCAAAARPLEPFALTPLALVGAAVATRQPGGDLRGQGCSCGDVASRPARAASAGDCHCSGTSVAKEAQHQPAILAHEGTVHSPFVVVLEFQ